MSNLAFELDFYRELNGVADPGQLKIRVADLIRQLGFSDYSYSRLASAEDLEPLLVSVPDALVDDYQAEEFYTCDLTLEHCIYSTTAIYQSSVENYIASAPISSERLRRNRQIYKMTRSFGFGDFFNVPVRAHNGNGNVMLAVTSKDEDNVTFWRKAEKRKASLTLLAEAIDYIGTRKFAAEFLGSSERRKIEITPKPLQLLAELAKSDLSLNDAAEKLGISVHTANQHVAAARRAFGVSTTSGAVYQAIKHGLIDV